MPVDLSFMGTETLESSLKPPKALATIFKDPNIITSDA